MDLDRSISIGHNFGGMEMNKDLMLAVLSMSAYKPVGNIGNAIQGIKQSDTTTGFAAVAYNYDGKTVISYRGSDTPLAVTAAVHLYRNFLKCLRSCKRHDFELKF
jgi:hypothetical protein